MTPGGSEAGSVEGKARSVFGGRSAFYAVSPAHADPHVLTRVVALAEPQPGWRGLDVGAGTGNTAMAIAPHVEFVVAADLTPEMLHQGTRLAAERGMRNVASVVADVHALPAAAGVFDLVTCRRAAHHFSAIERALAEIHRVLRPGGRLVVDDRSVPEDDAIDRAMDALDRYHDPSHVRQYRVSEWTRLLRQAGFTLDAVEPYVQHRPISSLTDGVPDDDVDAIQRLLDGLDSATRRGMDLREVEGVLHLTHWYVMISAKAEGTGRLTVA